MTPELFSDAMNEIGAKYVEEALTYKQAKPRALRRVLRTLLAAALISVLLFTSAFALSPSLREKAMTAFVHIFNDHTEVRFDGSEEFEPHGTGAIDCSALDG